MFQAIRSAACQSKEWEPEVFDPKVQDEPNGRWTEGFAADVRRVKEATGLTFQQLGDRFGFSGPFVSNLMSRKETHHMHSKHTERVREAVHQMMEAAGLMQMRAPVVADGEVKDDLASMVKRINQLGFSVELKPLKT